MAKTHTRRTPEQRIKDLEAEIEAVRARAAAKTLKSDPAVQEALKIARSLGKAEGVAKQCKDEALQAALSAAVASLSEYLEGRGLGVPSTRTGARRAG